LLTGEHIGLSDKNLIKTAPHHDNKHLPSFLSWLVPDGGARGIE
jgi:hypothetical protein